MNSINGFIKEYLNGNDWEELCVKCYRLRYQSDNYTSIPAVHGGDAGIEGFTSKGVVHQCYCPERDYSDDDFYAHLRDKMTRDLDKIVKNRKRLELLGVPPITEWHFNIPEYRDSRILAHALSKQNEILNNKEVNPQEYGHISSDFRVIIKIAEDFSEEIIKIIRLGIGEKLKLNVGSEEIVDWQWCDSEKVENVTRKIKAIINVKENNKRVNKIVDVYMSSYIKGIELMNDFEKFFPSEYEKIVELKNCYKKEVKVKTLLNSNKELNREVFEKILSDFETKLEEDFSDVFSQASIIELKNSLIANWLADCSMEFGGMEDD